MGLFGSDPSFLIYAAAAAEFPVKLTALLLAILEIPLFDFDLDALLPLDLRETDLLSGLI